MSSFNRDIFNQIATIWDALGIDKFGDRKYSAPRNIKVRWEDVNELYTSAKGEEMTSSARVFVQCRPALESYLALGDKTGTDNPENVSGAMRIKSVNECSDLDDKDRVIFAWL